MNSRRRSSQHGDAARQCRPIVLLERLEARVLLTLSVSNVSAVEGVPLTGVQVATFALGDIPGSVPSDFTATISWGDGGPITTGVVSSIAGGFAVSGNYTYRTAPPPGAPYTITVTVLGTSGVPFSASGLASVAPAALTSSGLSISATKGVPFAGVVAGFTDADTLLTTSDFTATINWGDGTTNSPGLISTAPSGTPGNFTVQGQVPHVYAAPGTYTVVTTITHAGQSTVASTTASVANTTPTIATTGELLTATAGQPIPPGTVVGSFVYNGTNAAPVFTAVINWGNGHTTVGNVTALPNSSTTFDVTGGNTYATPGTYTVGITVQDQYGEAATFSSSVVVTGPVLTVLSGNTFAVTPGVPVTTTVATFTDSNPLANSTDTSAVIAWGDGHVSQGTVTGPNANGLYTVTGTTTYANGPGPFNVTVTITDPSGLTGVAHSEALVTAPAINVTPTTFVFTPGVPFTTTVATFTDTNPLATSANTTAVIAWGDGHSSDGTITGPDANGIYTVTGTYTYQTAPAGPSYPVTVTITDPSGLTAHATGQANVSLPVLTAIPINITATPGISFTTAVATFSDSNPNAVAATPAALIAWGDGLSSSGTVTGPNANGIYTVTGTHTYFTPSPASDGQYTMTVTITDANGAVAVVHPSAYVPTPSIVVPSPTFAGGLVTGGTATDTDRPTFDGTTNPFALVQLFERFNGVDATVSLGQTIADANGNWSLLTGPLAQGIYTVTAVVTPPGGAPSAPFNVGSNNGQIIIDTTPPQVVGVAANKAHSLVIVYFRDDLSGMSLSSLSNPDAYTLAGTGSLIVHPTIATPLPSGGLPTDVQGVELTISSGPRVRRALRYLRVTAADITDNAGNALASNFHGALITKAFGRAGSNVVVKLGERVPHGPHR